MDIRVKTFGAEASRRLAFLVDELGFTGPVIQNDDGPFSAVAVSYSKDGVTVSSRLLLAYMGEESVITEIVTERPGAQRTTTTVGENTAHKGHEMRRALDKQSEALRTLLSG